MLQAYPNECLVHSLTQTEGAFFRSLFRDAPATPQVIRSLVVCGNVSQVQIARQPRSQVERPSFSARCF